MHTTVCVVGTQSTVDRKCVWDGGNRSVGAGQGSVCL